MKKLLLGTALVACAFLVTPAMAQDDSGVKLSLGGHFKGYLNYTNEDDFHSVDILRQTEVHFGGETTLDNGLTVGAHIEAEADEGDGFSINESYIYAAGSWGRINFGDEDGAAYLLQVAAPSADDNIDGIRQFINPSSTITTIGSVGRLDYANDATRENDKITYLSPVFNGFQAGVSFTPDLSVSRALAGNSSDDTININGSLYELAVRYEATFNTVGVILGAGYTHGSIENNAAVTQEGLDEWNVGADFDIGAFGIGAIYTENNNSSSDEQQNETFVIGGDYTTGPYKFGVSYLNNQQDQFTDSDLQRYTAGVIYTYGPGMSLRGSVGYIEQNFTTILAIPDQDATTVTIGTQINF